LSGSTSLELALKQLVESNKNPEVQLSVCHEADKIRLNQRFAYLAFAFSNGKGGTDWYAKSNECQWTGVTCNGNKARLYLPSRGLAGSIPADMGLWTGFTYIRMENNQLSGSLPSSIGLWTDITEFNVGMNLLVGTVPTEVSKWTSINSVQLSRNMVNGTMPTFGNNWCPKRGSDGRLFADCAEIKCDCCIDSDCSRTN
jgi:hypothetical protein